MTTALQHIVGSPEAAEEMLNDLEGIEEDHGQGEDEGWQLALYLEAEDLPVVRDELRELANGGE